MSITEPPLLPHRSPEVSAPRKLVLTTLRAAERGIADARSELGRRLDVAQLHLRARLESLDPSTEDWVAKARDAQPTQSAAEMRDELSGRIEEARKRLR